MRQLQSLWDDDPDGIKILWEQLNIVSGYTYGEYCKRGIPEEVFAATMKFCTRFLREHYKTFGFYKYVCAWWFPRQMSLNEFRIGALEYEFIDGEPSSHSVRRNSFLHTSSGILISLTLPYSSSLEATSCGISSNSYNLLFSILTGSNR